MPNLRNHRSTFVRGARRQTLWLAGVWTDSNIGTPGSVLLTSLNAAALALRPFTIVRTRGYMFLSSDQEVADENYAINYGEIVVTDEAVAAGIGSVPTPDDESASDWHVFELLAGRLSFGAAAETYEAGISKEFDSKAMRKVDLGENLITVAEVPVTGVSEGVFLRTFSRTLVKLH